MRVRRRAVEGDLVLGTAERISEEYMVVSIDEATNESFTRQYVEVNEIRYVKKSPILHLDGILCANFKIYKYYFIIFVSLILSAIATWLLFKIFPATPDAPNLMTSFAIVFSAIKALLDHISHCHKQFSLKPGEP